jgi:Zn-dependent peptidase ImmA (M78 family)/transcriptional regulator with XRE-family HTH domain
MVSEQTIRERLKQERLHRGWTEAELAEKLGKSGNAFVHRIENGPTKINLGLLKSLCGIYSISPLAILVPEKPEETPTSQISEKTAGVSRKNFFEQGRLRGHGTLSEDARSQIRQVLPYVRKLGTVLNRLNEQPIKLQDIGIDPDFPKPSNEFAARIFGRKAAKALRAYFNIGEGGSINVLDFAWNHLRIPVCGLDLGPDCWGFYSADQFGNPLIIYSTSHRFVQRNVFTIAHEIGHHLLQPDNIELDCDDASHLSLEEQMADSFAQELLVPSDSLRGTYDGMGLSLSAEITPRDIVRLSQRFKVSFLMICYCLKDLNKISEAKFSQLSSYCKEQLTNEARELKYIPKDYIIAAPPILELLEETVVRAFKRKVIGQLEASALLDLPKAELQRRL